MDAFCPFLSICVRVYRNDGHRRDTNLFYIRQLCVWTQIHLKFGSGLRPHGEQTDAPRVHSAPASFVSHPTTTRQSF